ncbi:MAG: DUF5010 domain-containing protein [Chloroflexota bacterium]
MTHRAGLAVIAALLVLALPASAQVPTDEDGRDYLSWSRPGPYRAPLQTAFDVQSFGANQKLVTTYFFYWYDAATYREAQSRRNFDPYPFKPPNLDHISFRDPAWYLTEFRDMWLAGIDFVLPDYWGEPGQYGRRVAPAPELNYFATEGLPPMVEALDSMAAEGKPLKVGLFLDTTIMNDEDLTTERGKAIFYATIRNYFSRIPPRHWAAVGGRPVVWLYDAQRVARFDQSSFDYVYERFPRDFGGMRPYVVRESQWERTKNVDRDDLIHTEGLYAWGAAPFGFPSDPRYTIAQVGPGFSNRQFNRPGFIHTEREDGRYYERQLQAAVESRRQVMAVETWNELGEASGILETVEFGRTYIELTRKYADLFKRQ